MGQVLHGSATTTEAVRRAIQNSQESLRALAKRYGINQKTVIKWKGRTSVADVPTGPRKPSSTVLTIEEEAVIVAFRRHTLLPLDDCLYALQPTIPTLTRSSLHRCLQRHGISRLPEVEGDKPAKAKFKHYPIGYFHVDIAEVQTAEGKLYLFVAIDRTSKFAYAELHEKAGKMAAAGFLRNLIAVVPYDPYRSDRQRYPVHQPGAGSPRLRTHLRPRLPRAPHRSQAHQGETSLDERSGRTHEPHHQGSHRQTLPLRRSRPTASAPCRLHLGLQFRPKAKDPEGPDAIRTHLQMLDK